MGLLDSLAGQVTGALSGNQGGGGLMDVVAGLLNSPQGGGASGLNGLIQAFEANGLGNIIGSWVGTGQNLPISAEQLQSVLGNGQLQALAQQFGFSPRDLSGQLAQLLPQVIDKLTPGGNVPQGDAMTQAMGMLGGLFK